MRIVSIFALCLLFPVVAMADKDSTPARITVVGEGSAAAAPDMATVRLAVSFRADSARGAMADVAQGTKEILAVLADFGLAPRDVQTSALTLNPIFETRGVSGRPLQPDGYEAFSQLSIRVRDLTALGTILDAVLESGANQLNGLQFSVQDTADLMTQARRAAIADARDRAETYAQAAGLTLGPVLGISESGAGNPMAEGVSVAAMRTAMPIAAGESEVQATVTVVYELTN